MFPNPIPEEPGCVSIRSRVKGDREVWVHVIWFAGVAYRLQRETEIGAEPPPLTILARHFDEHSDRWTAIAPVAQL